MNRQSILIVVQAISGAYSARVMAGAREIVDETPGGAALLAASLHYGLTEARITVECRDHGAHGSTRQIWRASVQPLAPARPRQVLADLWAAIVCAIVASMAIAALLLSRGGAR